MVESNILTWLSQMMEASMTGSDGRRDCPFGGVQIIVSGDFYQLPPVRNIWCFICGQELKGWKEKELRYTCDEHGDFDDEDKWAFCSPIWDACNFDYIKLKEIFRQRDRVFQVILGRCIWALSGRRKRRTSYRSLDSFPSR